MHIQCIDLIYLNVLDIFKYSFINLIFLIKELEQLLRRVFKNKDKPKGKKNPLEEVNSSYIAS